MLAIRKAISKSIGRSVGRGNRVGIITEQPDLTNLLAWYKTTITDGKLMAFKPEVSHATQQVRSSGFAGAGSATVTGLLTTDVISCSGSLPPTCTVDGTLTFAADFDGWDVWVHREEEVWAYWPGINVGQAIELDASGNGHHLTGLVGTTITELVDGSGTMWANEVGYSVADGTQYYDSLGIYKISVGFIIPPISAAYELEGYAPLTKTISTNNGVTVFDYVDQASLTVEKRQIDTLQAVAKTVHISITSTGADCGPAVVSKIVSRTTAKTSPTGAVIIVGSDVPYAGNNKHDNSMIERCDVTGAFTLDPSITPSTGQHAIEIGWNNKPTVRYCKINGAAYGIVVKGGGFDCDGSGGVIGNYLGVMGGTTVAPIDGIVVKGLTNIPVCHNFIYQHRAQYYVSGAITGRTEDGLYPTGNLFCQNNIVILDNAGSIYNLVDGAAVKNARANLYYAPSGLAFSGLSWQQWLAAGRVSDPDFERGSLYIRNASFGASWSTYNDEGVFISSSATNPLIDLFSVLWQPIPLDSSFLIGGGYDSPYVDYSLPDFWGNISASARNIGAYFGGGA